jgi:hypothetical protein
VIATGFDAATQQQRPVERQPVITRVPEQHRIADRAVPVAVPDFPVRTLDSENLDIPAFLRKHVRGSE